MFRLSQLQKILFLFVSLSLLAGCLGLPGRSQPLSREQKVLFLESFDEMTRMIEETFWDPQYLQECWGELKDECREQVEDAKSAGEARSAMRRLLASLEMSHFGVIPDSASQELTGSPSDGEAGMILRVSDGRAIVVRLEEGGAAEKVGIQPGDEILRVGERDLAPRLKEWGESGSRYLPIQALQSACSGEPGTEREYLVRNAQEDRTVTLTFQPPSDEHPRVGFGNIAPVPLKMEKRILEDDILYLRLSMFLGPMQVMPWFENAIQEHRDSKGLIIDLRGNPGGLGLMACGLAGWLIEDEGFELGTMKTKASDMNFSVNPRLDGWVKPVALLIDEGSASTSEIMAQGLRDIGRVRLFGRTTAGAALPSVLVKLPNGDILQYAMADYVSASGKRMEGVGVEPDEYIEVDPEQIRQYGDPVLKKAAYWILGKPGGPRSQIR
jgi:carboxyl-terminal processing protease